VRLQSRPIYLLVRLGENLLSVFSRFVNATFFGGSTYQSLSSRAWVDSTVSPLWEVRRRRIDWIFKTFFFQDHHCETYYRAEVAAARKTLLRAGFAISGE